MSWVELFKGLAPGIAALAAAGVAVAGLNTWRKQLRAKEEYDLARRVLRAALRVRDGFGAFGKMTSEECEC